MLTLREKTIDLSNLKDEDKILNRLSGNILSIQTDSAATIGIKGSHRNFDGEEMHPLTFIDMGTLSKISSITSPGIYMVLITGLDEVEFTYSGTGLVHIKELGE